MLGVCDTEGGFTSDKVKAGEKGLIEGVGNEVSLLGFKVFELIFS